MSTASLLSYLSSETHRYEDQTAAAEAKQQANRAQRSLAAQAQHQQIMGRASELSPGDSRNPNVLAEAAGYSEAKLREQQGRGIAPTGDAYSDARLRDQLGLSPTGTKSTAHPLENYLGSVDSPESYRTAMMQYVANGGQKPKWYTGNYEMDKGNLDTAVTATMTPQQQEVRAEAKERIAATKEQREAVRALKEREVLAKDRNDALKREDKEKALALKTIASPKELVSASNALETRLGIEQFDEMPAEQRTAVAREVSNKAKRRLATEGTAVDYNSLVEEEMDKLIAGGRLKLGKENPWYMPNEKPSFRAGPGEAAVEAAKASAKAVTTKADYDALPKGAIYTHPSNGKQYRKQ